MNTGLYLLQIAIIKLLLLLQLIKYVKKILETKNDQILPYSKNSLEASEGFNCLA